MVSATLAAGREALAAGDWSTARDEFEALVASAPSPDALDGLGLALWWLGQASESRQVRARAYSKLRDVGRLDDAARVAVWLAREHRDLYGELEVANGWLARAERCVTAPDATSAQGWLLLARAESAAPSQHAIEQLIAAARLAREFADPDLEVLALARLGIVEINLGAVEAGMVHLDEALAAATGGEGRDPRTIGEAYCALMEAADLLGDSERVRSWGRAVSEYLASYRYPPLQAYGAPARAGDLSSFCGACCGGIYLVTGRLEEAETELLAAIRTLEESGMRSRCVHPTSQLAELRMLQGRFDEARSLLEQYEHLPEAVRPLATLDLVEGNPELASARLRSRIDLLTGLPLAAHPLWSLLVDVNLALGHHAEAAAAVVELENVASVTKSPRHSAEALFGQGKVAAAQGEPDGAELLREAGTAFSNLSLPLLACRARFARARALLEREQSVAITESRAALAGFERLGAVVDADQAAAFLRELGVKGRTGPKELGKLSKREIEVLRLILQGLSNAEIADRLFISVKTAGHHVSSILTKLGMRSRTEAAAYAAINLDRTVG